MTLKRAACLAQHRLRFILSRRVHQRDAQIPDHLSRARIAGSEAPLGLEVERPHHIGAVAETHDEGRLSLATHGIQASIMRARKDTLESARPAACSAAAMRCETLMSLATSTFAV